MSAVLVKVANENSKLSFRNTKAYRAISVYELHRTAESHPSVNTVIVEGMYPGEERELAHFIEIWKKKEDRHVFFAFPEKDSVAYKYAVENNLEIVADRDGVYDKLRQIGIDASPLLKDRRVDDGKDNTEREFDTIEGIDADTEEEVVEELTQEEQLKSLESAGVYDSGPSIEEIQRQVEEELRKEAAADKAKTDAELSKLSETAEAQLSKIQELTTELRKQTLLAGQLSKKSAEMEERYKQAVLDGQAANNKLAQVTKLNKAIKDEKEALQKRFADLTSSEIIIEDPISLAEYEGIKAELEENRAKLESTRSNLASTRELVSGLKYDIELRDVEIGTLRESNEELHKQLRDIGDKGLDESTAQELKELRQKARRLESTVHDLTLDKGQLNDKVTQLTGDMDDLYGRIEAEAEINSQKNDIVKAVLVEMQSLKTAREDAEREKKLLAKDVESLRKQLDEKTAALKQAADEYAKARSVAESADSRISGAVQEVKQDRDRLDRLLKEKEARISALETGEKDKAEASNKALKSLTEQLNAANEKLSELTMANAVMREKVEGVDTQISVAVADEKHEKEKAQREVEQLRGQVNTLNTQLQSKTQQYNDIIDSVGTDADGINKIVAENKALQKSNSILNEKLSAAMNQAENNKKQATTAKKTAEELKTTNTQLRNSLQLLMNGGGSNGAAGAKMVKQINYRANAQIISVFGNGSYGITTVARSLASKLAVNSRVLIMDFDITNPGLDVKFMKSPVTPEIKQLFQGDVSKTTGLGLFLELGIKEFAKHKDQVIKEVEKSKGGGLYYLSGLHFNFDRVKHGAALYEELYNVLGSDFNYIVIDFGKLGVSDVQDKIISETVAIGLKAVAVTQNDRWKAKDMARKLAVAGIPPKSVRWLLNMAYTTAYDDKTREFAAGASIDIVPWANEAFQRNVDLRKVRDSKDKFDLFISNLIRRQ